MRAATLSSLPSVPLYNKCILLGVCFHLGNMIPLLRCIQRRDLSTALARVRRKHKAAIVIGFYGGKWGCHSDFTRSYSGMQTNDLKSSIEDKLIGVLYELGKIGFSNVSRPAKFDWERCSRWRFLPRFSIRDRQRSECGENRRLWQVPGL